MAKKFTQEQLNDFLAKKNGKFITVLGGNHQAEAYSINRKKYPTSPYYNNRDIIIYNKMETMLVCQFVQYSNSSFNIYRHVMLLIDIMKTMTYAKKWAMLINKSQFIKK